MVNFSLFSVLYCRSRAKQYAGRSQGGGSSSQVRAATDFFPSNELFSRTRRLFFM